MLKSNLFFDLLNFSITIFLSCIYINILFHNYTSKIPANCHVRFTLFRLSKFNLKIHIFPNDIRDRKFSAIARFNLARRLSLSSL